MRPLPLALGMPLGFGLAKGRIRQRTFGLAMGRIRELAFGMAMGRILRFAMVVGLAIGRILTFTELTLGMAIGRILGFALVAFLRNCRRALTNIVGSAAPITRFTIRVVKVIAVSTVPIAWLGIKEARLPFLTLPFTLASTKTGGVQTRVSGEGCLCLCLRGATTASLRRW